MLSSKWKTIKVRVDQNEGLLFWGTCFCVERKQSKWRVTLCTTTCCLAPQCGKQSLCWYLKIRPCRYCRQGFWEGLDHEDMERIHHPSPIQILIIQLLGDSPDSSVSPGQGAQGFQPLWLAEDLGSVSAFSSVSNGEWVQCLLQFQMPYWREKGAIGRDRGAPPHVPVCSPTTSRSGSHICCKEGHAYVSTTQ